MQEELTSAQRLWCQHGLAAGDSALRLQASSEAKCLQEEAALGPKYRLEMEKGSWRDKQKA